ncbi:DnaJ family domain-containing protein [Marinicrinis lubricantis]|uniref:DnaJ family domain-containing protein n=1 Tax=Marinicrinis lubricantis TaxID=2086470 RepID=A0ABW1ITK5_9BACL
MDFLEKLAEERIKAAIHEGELDNLPGKGKPIEYDDLQAVPEELRASYRMLKNAGVLPPKMELKKEMVSLEELIRCCEDAEQKEHLKKQLSEKMLRFQIMMEKRNLSSSVFQQYRGSILNKIK